MKIFEFNPSMKKCKKMNFHILTFLANKLIKTYLKSAVIASALLVVIWFVVLNKIEITMQNMSQKVMSTNTMFSEVGWFRPGNTFIPLKEIEKKNLLVTQPMGAQSETTENITFCYLLPT